MINIMAIKFILVACMATADGPCMWKVISPPYDYKTCMARAQSVASICLPAALVLNFPGLQDGE